MVGRQKYYLNKISPGDEVFIWRSDGSKKYSGGIIAKGVIISEPSIIHDDQEVIKLWKVYPGEGYRVQIFIEDLRLSLSKGMLSRKEIEKDICLRNLQIIKFRQLTNYFIDEKLACRLRLLWALKRMERKL